MYYRAISSHFFILRELVFSASEEVLDSLENGSTVGRVVDGGGQDLRASCQAKTLVVFYTF